MAPGRPYRVTGGRFPKPSLALGAMPIALSSQIWSPQGHPCAFLAQGTRMGLLKERGEGGDRRSRCSARVCLEHLSRKVMPTDNEDAEVEVRRFEPWRYAKTERARALVREIIGLLDAEKQARRDRTKPTRAQKPIERVAREAAVEALACDLAHLRLSAAPDAPERLTVPLSNGVLAGGPPRYRAPALTKQLRGILNQMHALGILVLRIGDRSCHAHVYTDEPGRMRPRKMTTVEVGPALAERIKRHGLVFGDLGLDAEGEVIILKRAKEDRWDTADWINYEETPETRRDREELRRHNAWLASAHIEVLDLPHIDASDRHLRRVFTRASFCSGGRLAGGFWMNMERDLRLTRLRIEGERVASIDFNNFYAHLLYAKEEVAAPQGDLYSFPGLEAYRRGMKRLFSARLFDEWARKSKPKRTPKEIREGVQLYPDDVNIGELLDILSAGHRPIARFFGSGIGHSLQFVESEVLMRILRELERAGIVGLPIHDCVIVARCAAQETKEIMAKVTREATGVCIPVSVEFSDEEARA
jgi:hypothetical protein